jgi:hypothetical protein
MLEIEWITNIFPKYIRSIFIVLHWSLVNITYVTGIFYSNYFFSLAYNDCGIFFALFFIFPKNLLGIQIVPKNQPNLKLFLNLSGQFLS